MYCNYRFIWTCLYYVILNFYLSCFFYISLFSFYGRDSRLANIPCAALHLGVVTWVILNNRNESDCYLRDTAGKGGFEFSTCSFILLQQLKTYRMVKPSSIKSFNDCKEQSLLPTCTAVQQEREVNSVCVTSVRVKLIYHHSAK